MLPEVLLILPLISPLFQLNSSLFLCDNALLNLATALPATPFDAPTLALKMRIFRGKLMSILAMCALSHLRASLPSTFTPNRIYATSHNFKVLRIHTCSIAAEMVCVQPFVWPPSSFKIQHHGMSRSLLPLEIEKPIASMLRWVIPHPTITPWPMPRRFVDARKKSFSGILELYSQRSKTHLFLGFGGVCTSFSESAHASAFTFRSLSQRRVLHDGHIFGVPVMRCAH